MIHPRPAKFRKRASSLVEAVIAIGVLAVVIPLVLATLAQAGRSGASAEAETRCSWMVPTCMDEIRASRDGLPRFFTTTTVGQQFPPAGDIWALAFSTEGQVVGKITKPQFDQGLKELNGKPVLYLAEMTAVTAPVKADATPMMNVRITIGYPAGIPSAKRQKLDFHTRIP
jgi:type II secretory pathway pseudopilin PulG